MFTLKLKLRLDDSVIFEDHLWAFPEMSICFLHWKRDCIQIYMGREANCWRIYVSLFLLSFWISCTGVSNDTLERTHLPEHLLHGY